MKKFLFFTLGLLLFGGKVSAQDAVYLRNGSMIRGSVLEQEMGKSVKVQTQDGSIYIYSMSEVERIAKNYAQVRQRNAMQVRTIMRRRRNGTAVSISM